MVISRLNFNGLSVVYIVVYHVYSGLFSSVKFCRFVLK